MLYCVMVILHKNKVVTCDYLLFVHNQRGAVTKYEFKQTDCYRIRDSDLSTASLCRYTAHKTDECLTQNMGNLFHINKLSDFPDIH